MTKTVTRSAFTLIELILVVAIVAILATLAIGKFTDMRKDAARKANVANIKNIARTINTELARLDGETSRGMFAYAESLIDCPTGGGDARGSEGSYDWNGGSSWYDGNGGTIPGIYCGIKLSEATANKAGVSTGTVTPLFTAHEENLGLEKFESSLGLYYLKAAEVDSLRDAGVSIVSRHNYSTAQASQLKWSDSVYCREMGLHATGGGPGMRPDLSACYPVVLTNGSAVAVINPAKGASIWRDLGCDYATTNNVAGLSESSPETYFTKGICKRLVVVGLGRDCEATTKFFENAPRCMTLDRKHYRSYLLVFEMANGTGNGGTAARFVGVLDPNGNTAKQAQYDADWSS